jgi:hypothetical protein
MKRLLTFLVLFLAIAGISAQVVKSISDGKIARANVETQHQIEAQPQMIQSVAETFLAEPLRSVDPNYVYVAPEVVGETQQQREQPTSIGVIQHTPKFKQTPKQRLVRANLEADVAEKPTAAPKKGPKSNLLSEDFSGTTGGALPTGWTRFNLGTATQGWVASTPTNWTNPLLASFWQNGHARNTWAITPGLSLIAGEEYQMNFLLMMGYNDPDDLEDDVLYIRMGTDATVAAMEEGTLLFSNIGIIPELTPTNVTFTPTTTGTYYIGFHAATPNSMGDLIGIDDLVIFQTPTGPGFNGPTTLAFGNVHNNTPVVQTRNYIINNTGVAPLTVNVNTTATDAALTTNVNTLTIAPGERDTLRVTLNTSVLPVGAYTGTLALTTNDPDNAEVAVNVTATVAVAVILTELNENFDVALPAGSGWATAVFSRVTSGGINNTGCMRGNQWNAGSNQAVLQTPYVVIGEDQLFKFNWLASGYNNNDATAASNFVFGVFMTIDYGANWEEIFFSNDHTAPQAFQEVMIGLAEYAGETAMFQIVYLRNAGDYDIRIDDVSVAAIPQIDVALLAIPSPNSGVNLSNAETVTVRVQNQGLTTITSLPLFVEVNGGLTLFQTFRTPIASFETVDLTFTGTLDLSAGGTYTISVFAELPGDEDPDNDRVTKSVVNSFVAARPIPYFEGFEGTTGNNLSANWLRVGGANVTGTGVVVGAWQTATSTTSFSGITRAPRTGTRYLAAFNFNASAANRNMWAFSVPIAMEAGKTYNISFFYQIPAINSGGVPIPPNDVQLMIGSNTNVASMTAQLWETNANVDAWTEVVVQYTPTVTGSYHLGFNDRTQAGTGALPAGFLAIFDDVSIVEAITNDIALAPVMLPFTQMPITQVVPQVIAQVKNIGSAPQTNVNVSATLNGNALGTGTAVPTMAPLATSSFTITPTAQVPLGANTVVFTATQTETDANPANNTSTATFVGTNNVFAADDNVAYWLAGSGAMPTGNIYTVSNQVTLNAVEIRFNAATALTVNIVVRRVANLATLELEADPVLATTISRSASAWTRYNVPATVLTPGTYFFEMRTNSGDLAGLAVETGPNGYNRVDNFLVPQTSGARFIRAVVDLGENDLTIVAQSPFVATQVPASQITASFPTFPASLVAQARNIGTATQTEISYSALFNGETYGPSNEIATLASGALSGNMTIATASVPMPTAVGTYNLTYTLTQAETDDNPANNVATFPLVIGNTYALDAVTAFDNGVGSNDGTISGGNIFTIHNQAVLKQVQVGFGSSVEHPDLTVSLFRMTSATAINGTALFTVPITRTAMGLTTIDVPPTFLTAGDYFLCLDQRALPNMSLSFDETTRNATRLRTKTLTATTLSTQTGFGAGAIRMVLDAVPEFDVAVEAITAPTAGSPASTAVPVSVRIRNTGVQNVTSVALTLTLNGTPVATETWTGELATNATAIYTFDATINISAESDHVIMVTSGPDDNLDNNVATVTITTVWPVVSPFIFENFAETATPQDWLYTFTGRASFSRQTAGGINNTPSIRANIYGSTTNVSATVTTGYVAMGANPAISFNYRALGYSATHALSSNNPNNFTYMVEATKDFGTTWDTLLRVLPGQAVPNPTGYATVNVPMGAKSAAYANTTARVRITMSVVPGSGPTGATDPDMYAWVDAITVGTPTQPNNMLAEFARFPYTVMPVSQMITSDLAFSATAFNLGSGAQTNTALAVTLDGNAVATSTPSTVAAFTTAAVTATPTAATTLNLGANVLNYSLTSANYTGATAFTGTQTVVGTHDVYAADNPNVTAWIGADIGNGVTRGHVFTITEATNIAAVQARLASASGGVPQIFLQEVDRLQMVGTPLIDNEPAFTTGRVAGWNTQVLDAPIALAPGTYFLGITQSTSAALSLHHDQTTDGRTFYTRSGGDLTRHVTVPFLTAQGMPCVRMVIEMDPAYTVAATAITAPVSGTNMSNNSPVNANFANYGTQALVATDTLNIQLEIDGPNGVVTFDTVRTGLTTAMLGTFTLNFPRQDFSAPGDYTITITTTFTNRPTADVMVFETVITNITIDAGIVAGSLTSPVDGPDKTATESVTLTVQNFGSETFDMLPISLFVNGLLIVRDTITATLTAGQQFVHTFSQTIDMSVIGVYDILAVTTLSGDGNRDNNNLLAEVIHGAPDGWIDVAAVIIDQPGGNSSMFTATEEVIVDFRNLGAGTITNVPVRLLVNGVVVANETIAGPITTMALESYTFTQTIDLSTPGMTYTIEAVAMFPGDMVSSNDTARRTVTNIKVVNTFIQAINAPPVTGTNLTATEAVTVVLENAGTFAQTNVPITLYVGGTLIATESVPNVPRGATPALSRATYTFTATANLSAHGQTPVRIVIAPNNSVTTSVVDTTRTVTNTRTWAYTVNVTTNAPGITGEGAVVTLTPTTGTALNATANATGVATFATVPQGTYTVGAKKAGFDDYTVATPVTINAAGMSANVTLIETKNAPADLAINVNGFDATLTWTHGTPSGGDALVTLAAGDVWGDGSGFIMLLDQSATWNGVMASVLNPINSPNMILTPFSHFIPTNITANVQTTPQIFNSSATIEVPPGTYDLLVLNRDRGANRFWVTGGLWPSETHPNETFGNDFVFEGGKHYTFTAARRGTSDAVTWVITDARAPEKFTAPGTFNVYLNDNLVASNVSANTYTFSALEPGTYTAGVEAVYASGASTRETIGFTIIPPNSIQPEFDNLVAVYPNPVQDVLNISTDLVVRRVEILNVHGQIVRVIEGSVTEIPVSNLTSGVYFVRITTDKGISTQRIVKN